MCQALGHRAASTQVKTLPLWSFHLQGAFPTLAALPGLSAKYPLVNMRLGVKFLKHALSFLCASTVLSILYTLSHWHLHHFQQSCMEEALLVFSFYRRDKEAHTPSLDAGSRLHTRGSESDSRFSGSCSHGPGTLLRP